MMRKSGGCEQRLQCFMIPSALHERTLIITDGFPSFSCDQFLENYIRRQGSRCSLLLYRPPYMAVRESAAAFCGARL